MPLVAHTALPTFARLREEGQTVLSEDYAFNQDIRELHIGFLNMMPDAALEATERQFFRLVGESNLIAQFHLHPFTLQPFVFHPSTLHLSLSLSLSRRSAVTSMNSHDNE